MFISLILWNLIFLVRYKNIQNSILVYHVCIKFHFFIIFKVNR
uniref:Uncharacterized protein n=1 Tax=Bostrychia tenella TaxID=324755 RepID=A0A1Z1M677_9FLOR|nr:hypothetical protein [Bostrychia tenella]ARW61351.1 hypothetical protein [Bostrychia tenella]